MKNLIYLFTGILLISFTSINAQNTFRVDEIEVINSKVSNVTIQIKTAEFGQEVLSRINQSDVNGKEGFDAQFSADNTLLSLNFTQQFNSYELKTLLKYSGLELREEDINQLYNLLNQ